MYVAFRGTLDYDKNAEIFRRQQSFDPGDVNTIHKIPHVVFRVDPGDLDKLRDIFRRYNYQLYIETPGGISSGEMYVHVKWNYTKFGIPGIDMLNHTHKINIKIESRKYEAPPGTIVTQNDMRLTNITPV